MQYAISTLKKKAREHGYSLQCGYQRYFHPGWGYVRDYLGNRTRGYQILDYCAGYVICGTGYLHDYSLTEEEAVSRLRELLKEKGIKI